PEPLRERAELGQRDQDQREAVAQPLGFGGHAWWLVAELAWPTPSHDAHELRALTVALNLPVALGALELTAQLAASAPRDPPGQRLVQADQVRIRKPRRDHRSRSSSSLAMSMRVRPVSMHVSAGSSTIGRPQSPRRRYANASRFSRKIAGCVSPIV